MSKNECFINQVKKNTSELFTVLKIIPVGILALFVMLLPAWIGLIAPFFISDPVMKALTTIVMVVIGIIWSATIGIPLVNCYIVKLPGSES
jgi:hypothetical protein